VCGANIPPPCVVDRLHVLNVQGAAPECKDRRIKRRKADARTLARHAQPEHGKTRQEIGASMIVLGVSTCMQGRKTQEMVSHDIQRCGREEGSVLA
jgi:hypothetical protein